jgi:hypothetical protein
MTLDSDGFAIDVDLDHVRKSAEDVRDRLAKMRRRFDLAQFEYTRRVRISPTEIPHSHPILTLNTRPQSDDALLCTYLHEQMHWYLWRLGSPSFDPVAPFYDELKRRYPAVPTHIPDGANDEYSTYLHLVVNWLEIEAASGFLGRELAISVALATPVYRWIYRQVIEDWDELGLLYGKHKIIPIKAASHFSDQITADLNNSETDDQM